MNVSYESPVLVITRLLTGGCVVELGDDVKRVDESVDRVDEVVKRVMVDVEDNVVDDSVDVVESVVLKLELELVVVSGTLVVDDVVNDDDDVVDVDVVDVVIDEVVDEVDEGELSLSKRISSDQTMKSILTSTNTIDRGPSFCRDSGYRKKGSPGKSQPRKPIKGLKADIPKDCLLRLFLTLGTTSSMRSL